MHLVREGVLFSSFWGSLNPDITDDVNFSKRCLTFISPFKASSVLMEVSHHELSVKGLSSLPNVHLHFDEQIAANRGEFVCAFYNPDFIIWSSLSSFYIPCFVMIFLYVRIFKVNFKTEEVLRPKTQMK